MLSSLLADPLPYPVQYTVYSTVQYSTVLELLPSSLLVDPLPPGTVLYSTVLYSTVQYSTVQYSTVLELLPSLLLAAPHLEAGNTQY